MVLSHYQLLPEAPDSITYDWRTAFFSEQATAQRKDITVVLITEDTLRGYFSRSPTDRALLAEIVRAIDSAHPRAIGLDFIFDRLAEQEKTDALIAAIREASAPIVIGSIDKRARRVRAADLIVQKNFLKRAGRPTGHLFYGSNSRRFRLDEDVVRLMASPGPSGIGSFANVVTEQAIGRQVSEPPSRFIAWQRPPQKFGTQLFPILRIPEHKRVDGNGTGETVIPKNWHSLLKDRIILVGGDLIDQDQHQTPLTILDRKRVPGVTIHAQIIAQLIDGRGIRTMAHWAEVLYVCCISALAFFLGYRFGIKRYDIIVSIVGLLALIAAGTFAFARWQLIIPSTTLFLAWIVGVTLGHFSAWFFERYRSAV